MVQRNRGPQERILAESVVESKTISNCFSFRKRIMHFFSILYTLKMRCFPLKRTYVAGIVHFLNFWRIKKTRKEFLFYLLSCLQFIDGLHYLVLICFLSVHRHFSDQCSHYCRITVNRFSNKYPSYNSISNCLNIFLSPTFFVNFANRLTSKTHWLPRVKYRQFFC